MKRDKRATNMLIRYTSIVTIDNAKRLALAAIVENMMGRDVIVGYVVYE